MAGGHKARDHNESAVRVRAPAGKGCRVGCGRRCGLWAALASTAGATHMYRRIATATVGQQPRLSARCGVRMACMRACRPTRPQLARTPLPHPLSM